MAKTPRPEPKRKRPPSKAQSARFKKAALDLQAAGALNLTDAEEQFERAFKRVAFIKRKLPS
jgi:hypothetical protein